MVRRADGDPEVITKPFVVVPSDDDCLPEEMRMELVGTTVVYPAEDKVRLRGIRAKERVSLQLLEETVALATNQFHAFHQPLAVGESSLYCDLCSHAHVERLLDAPERPGDVRWEDAVPDTQAGESSPLTERPEDDDVVVPLGKRLERRTSELVVRLVDDEQYSGVSQSLELASRDEVPGRIVR